MAEHLERQLVQLREETSTMLRLHQEGFKHCIDEWSARHQQLLQELGALGMEGLHAAAAAGGGGGVLAPYPASAPVDIADSCPTSAKLALGSCAATPAAEATRANDIGASREVKHEGSRRSYEFYEDEESEGYQSSRRKSFSWTAAADDAKSEQERRRRPSMVAASQAFNDGMHQWRTNGTKQSLKIFVEGPTFSLVSGALIFGMVVLMGCETDYLAHTGETHPAFVTLQIVLNVYFIIELLLRLVAYGPWRVFIRGEDRLWNLIDLGLILIFLMEFLSTLSSSDGFVVFRMLRTCRLLRLTRVFKVLRMVNYVQEIRKIFLLLAASARTLLWSLLSVVFVIYIFAVLFTESTTGYFSSLPREEWSANEHQLFVDFGTVGKSIFSLYTAVSGGRNWGTFVDPLDLVGWPSVAVFVGFISFFFFGVLNIVTSVFVECAMQSAQRHCELLVAEKREAELQHLKHMKAIFKMIDMDNSRTVELTELESRLQDNRHLQDYFKALELNATDTLTLFNLLDQDDSGSLTYDEFCEGCMRLKGEARAFDINCLIQENRNAGGRLVRFTKFSKEKMNDLDQRLRDVCVALSTLQRTVAAGAHPGAAAASSGSSRDWDPTCWEQAPGTSDDAEPGRAQAQ